MMLVEITSPKLFLTPNVLEPVIKSDVETMGIKQASQHKLVHARKELQMDDPKSELRKENDVDSKSLHSNLKILGDSGPHQMKKKIMKDVTKDDKEIKEPPQKKSKFAFQEQKNKINSRGRRNLDHPTIRSLVEHQNCLFMKEH